MAERHNRAPAEQHAQTVRYRADTIADAQMFVGNHLKITNQQIEFYKLLTDGEIDRLRLKRGEVKRYS